MHYPLENLGPDRFQQLCQSLLSKSFPDLQCFPISQPDGGRDATLLSHSQNTTDFIVYQVKYTKNALHDTQPHKTVIDSLRKELSDAAVQIPPGATKYILITNVQGTAVPTRGSIDVVQKLLDDHIPVPAQCWWRDEIERRLDDAWDIKWSFPEILRNQDILRIIIEQGLTEDADRRTAALRAFIREQFEYDTDVRFKQVDLQNNLLDLFVDVPVIMPEYHYTSHDPRNDQTTLFAVARQHHSLSPHTDSPLGTATLLLDPLTQTHIPRVVIEGAPGQGKSTIVQYICQIHRERLLNQGNTDHRIDDKHRDCPIRLPFKVDCRDFAAWLRGQHPFSLTDNLAPPQAGVRTLESFLATQVEYHSGGATFNVSDLHAVLRMSAILIVFDGLDEVADIAERRAVVDAITKGIRRVQELSLSVQTIVTTRPTSFTSSPSLSPNIFSYLQLGPIDKHRIASYAEKWVAARNLRDRDARDVQRTLTARLDQPHLRDLARNPMQLAILLSLIHRKGPSLPDKRTALYDNYIDLFFDREAEKSTIVREYRDLLVDIHRHLAWILHSEAQTKRTNGKIETPRLRNVVMRFLEAAGHDVALVDQLFSGVVERVVALVSRIEGTYEFEVQPMREYFAARYLYDTAPYSPAGDVKSGTLPERFEALARDPYWQNVTRFYAGCYSQGQLPSLLTSLRILAQAKGYRTSSYPQSLAATLVSDYTFAQYPLICDEVVDFILNSVDFRMTLASEQFGTRQRALYLPKDNGNTKLVERCGEELLHEPKADYAQILVDTIAANSEPKERRERWWEGLHKVTRGAQLTQWMSCGVQLGALQDSDENELDALLADDEPEYRKRITSLALGGMWRYVSRDERRVETVVDAILNGDTSLEFYREGTNIHAFACALSNLKYLIAFQSTGPRSLSQIWEGHGLFSASLREQAPAGKGRTTLIKCHAFVEKSAELSQKLPASAWTVGLEPWEELIECGRQLFDDQWAFFVLANSSAGILSKIQQSSEATKLFNENEPIARRARHARLRAGHWRWWSEHLAQASNQMNLAFILLLTFTWAGRTVILGLKDEIESALQTLDGQWWQRLFHALADQGRVFIRRRAIRITGSEFGKQMSARMVVALSYRVSDAVKQDLFRKRLSQYNGNDAAVLEYCEDAALHAVFSLEADEWRNWLPAISDRYKRGTRSISRGQPWPLMFYRERLPLDMAEEIVEHSDGYPVALVRWAEHACRASIAKQVVPVGKAAKENKWFEA